MRTFLALAPAPTHPGLRPLDWVVIFLYGGVLLAIGAYYSRRQKSTEDYFVGGRNMKSWLVGLSLFATLLSTISYLAQPGEIIKHGPVILTGLFYVPIVFVVVGYLLIPKFMRLKVTSAYEVLEGQFGNGGRVFGATLFLATRLVWMALMMFLTAKVMVVVLGLDDKWTPLVIALTGIVTVAYTGAGGLEAVVMTDVLQFFVLMAGALVTILLISIHLGSVSAWIPTSWSPHWDRQPFFSFDPTVRATVVGSILNASLWWICTASSDQMAVQRYAATPSAKTARRAFLINCIADVTVGLILAAVGFALLAYFRSGVAGEGVNPLNDADYLFPNYIANYVPAGVAGLVIAGMFSAAMSSLSSGINSSVTVLTVDFIGQSNGTASGRAGVRRARLMSFGIGIVVILLGMVIGKVPGNIMEVTNKTNGLFVGPLAGLFILALFVPFSTCFGAVWGAIYGFAAAFVVAFWDVLSSRPGLSFQYIIAAALIAHLVVGMVLSLISRRGLNGRWRLAWNVIAALPLVLAAFGIVRLDRGTSTVIVSSTAAVTGANAAGGHR